MTPDEINVLNEIREGLLSLARAHRSVIPPAEVTATALTDWSCELRDMIKRAQQQEV